MEIRKIARWPKGEATAGDIRAWLNEQNASGKVKVQVYLDGSVKQVEVLHEKSTVKERLP